MYLQRMKLLQKSNEAFKKMMEKRKVSVNEVYVCACGLQNWQKFEHLLYF